MDVFGVVRKTLVLIFPCSSHAIANAAATSTSSFVMVTVNFLKSVIVSCLWRYVAKICKSV